jgi:hypothetical protein
MVCVCYFILKENVFDSLDLFAVLKRYVDQRQIAKQLESQLKSATLKTKSQRWNFYFYSEKKRIHFVVFSQQIQDQRQRRLNSANRAARSVRKNSQNPSFLYSNFIA